jgi:hypothetical protein
MVTIGAIFFNTKDERAQAGSLNNRKIFYQFRVMTLLTLTPPSLCLLSHCFQVSKG